MNAELWNKLYYRCLRATRRGGPLRRNKIRARWLAVMDRRAGKNCSFAPWPATDD